MLEFLCDIIEKDFITLRAWERYMTDDLLYEIESTFGIKFTFVYALPNVAVGVFYHPDTKERVTREEWEQWRITHGIG